MKPIQNGYADKMAAAKDEEARFILRKSIFINRCELRVADVFGKTANAKLENHHF